MDTLRAEATSTTGLGLLLQLVRDLLVRLEELGGAAVEAHGLALAEVAFAVRLVNALEGADLDHAICRGRCKLVMGLFKWLKLGLDYGKGVNGWTAIV